MGHSVAGIFEANGAEHDRPQSVTLMQPPNAGADSRLMDGEPFAHVAEEFLSYQRASIDLWRVRSCSATQTTKKRKPAHRGFEPSDVPRHHTVGMTGFEPATP